MRKMALNNSLIKNNKSTAITLNDKNRNNSNVDNNKAEQLRLNISAFLIRIHKLKKVEKKWQTRSYLAGLHLSY